MKKYLMTSVSAVALGLALTSCNHDFKTYTQAEIDQANYEAAFINYVGGTISPDQDWGFGDDATRGLTRSQAAPEVLDINVDAMKTYAADILTKSVEVTSDNAGFNNAYATTTIQKGTPGGYTGWNWNVVYGQGDEVPQKARDYYASLGYPGNLSDEARDYIVAHGWTAMLTGTAATEDVVVFDARYVNHYKISSTWTGGISAMGNAGIEIKEYSVNDDWTLNVTKIDTVAKTVYIADGGKWVLPAGESYTVGQGITKSDGSDWGTDGVIIVGNGGTLEVNGTLNMANCARLIVLHGGKVTGSGLLQVNNGNFEGSENYNGGTIDVATFNNNFGKFYNYGKFLVNEYQGGAQESNFYNHALAAIDHFGPYDSSTANARIFNGCQFYVKNDARIRNYEGVGGSALIVGGELMFSGSEDGTTTPSYVGLAAGALVQCNTLYNNGTSWTGPTGGGYAALDIEDKITFLNWEQDAPQNAGYFENNIYVYAKQWDNIPGGNGWQAGETAIADYKFFQIVANSRGNGNVKKVSKGNNEVLTADDDFELGEAGCTPGFKISETPEETQTEAYDLRIIAEDLSANQASDFDFNDVVIDVKYGTPAKLLLQAAGGTLQLKVGSTNGEGGYEVHELFDVDQNVMVNTNWTGSNSAKKPAVEIPLNINIETASEANTKLRIEVFKNGTWQLLTANKGEAACKIGVTPDFQWLDERESIKDKYENFTSWVANGKPVVWW